MKIVKPEADIRADYVDGIKAAQSISQMQNAREAALLEMYASYGIPRAQGLLILIPWTVDLMVDLGLLDEELSSAVDKPRTSAFV